MPAVATTAPDCFAVDTDGKITLAIAKAVAASQVTIAGKTDRPRAIGRYCSLHAPEVRSDLTPDEMHGVWDEDLGLWLFQHVLEQGWVASAQRGADLGGAARENALAIGYAAGCHVFMDLEGTSSVGEPVMLCVEAWAAEMAKAFPPGLYRGYASGLSAQQAYEIPNVHLYAKAFGPWGIAVVGQALEQQPQVVLPGTGGMYFDPQLVQADARGRRLVWMADPMAARESGAPPPPAS